MLKLFNYLRFFKYFIIRNMPFSLDIFDDRKKTYAAKVSFCYLPLVILFELKYI